MYQYLKKVLYLSEEIQFILKLININQANIAITAFLHMILKDGKWSQYENIMKIIIKHVVDKCMVRMESFYLLGVILLILHGICVFRKLI